MEETRIDRLIKEVINSLPVKIKNFFVSLNVKFYKFNSNIPYFYGLHGCVLHINPNIIRLNLFSLQYLSDFAVKGVIAHELGHVYMLHNQDIYSNIVTSLIPAKRFIRKFEEKRADKLSKKWGFTKEINSLRKEAVYKILNMKNNGEIDIYKEDKLIPLDEKRVDIHLACNKCKLNYKIEYTYLIYYTKASFLINNYAKGEINFDYPIPYKKLIEDVKCIECGSDLTITKIVKDNPFLK